jgi:hypothetical protein
MSYDWKFVLLSFAFLSTIAGFFCFTSYLPESWATAFFTLSLVLVTAHYAITTAENTKATRQMADTVYRDWQMRKKPLAEIGIEVQDHPAVAQSVSCRIANKSYIPFVVRRIFIEMMADGQKWVKVADHHTGQVCTSYRLEKASGFQCPWTWKHCRNFPMQTFFFSRLR